MCSFIKKNVVDSCSIFEQFSTTHPRRNGTWACGDFDKPHAFSNFLLSLFLAWKIRKIPCQRVSPLHSGIVACIFYEVKNIFHLPADVVSCFLFPWKTAYLFVDVHFTGLLPGRRVSANNCSSVWTQLSFTNYLRIGILSLVVGEFSMTGRWWLAATRVSQCDLSFRSIIAQSCYWA